MQELDSLYKDIILDHNKDPRNFGHLSGADVTREGFNPLCGDRITVELKFDADRTKVTGCMFHGEGCSICLASASIMTEEVIGASIAKVQESIADFRSLMQGSKDPKDFDGDIEALAGVRRFSVRIKCALLGWVTLKDALEQKNDHDEGTSHVSKTE